MTDNKIQPDSSLENAAQLARNTDYSQPGASDPTSTAGKGDNADNYNFDSPNDDTLNQEGRSTRPTTRAPPPKNAALVTVQPLQKRDMQPSYAQDLGTEDLNMGFYGSLINCLGAVAGGLGQIPCCFCCPNPYKEVQQGSVGLVSRFGKFYKAVDPGLVKTNVFSETIKRVDVKIQLSNIPSQKVITKDNVNVQIDSVIYWHVSNPYRAVFGIGDVSNALIERAQTTLRDVVGSRNLQNIIGDREGVALQVEEIVESVAERWGVTVESILIKDIIFSKELQESLSSAATQTRIGQAKVIAARAEVDAAKLMRQAADVLSSKPALQLRELEALQNMAKSAGSKVIFVPMNLQSNGSDWGNNASTSTGGSGYTAVQPGQQGQAGQGGMNVAQLNQLAEM
ncbi:unnamed protein product [Sympodiomycopsis kandeliae]